MTTPVTSQSTQAQHPWRAAARTVLAAAVGIIVSWAVIIEAIGLDPGIPWVATSLTIAAAVTRVISLPAVIKHFPWLSPDGTK